MSCNAWNATEGIVQEFEVGANWQKPQRHVACKDAGGALWHQLRCATPPKHALALGRTQPHAKVYIV